MNEFKLNDLAIKKNHQIVVLVLAVLTLILLVSTAVLAENFTSWFSMSSGTTKNLNSVWGVTSTDVFGVGESGTILHYDGSKWSSMSSNTTKILNNVWGVRSTDVLAVGESGTILHYDGSAWNSITNDIIEDLYGIWGFASSDIFVVGSSGTILHYDGSIWSAMNSGITANLYSVWGVTNNDVFAVGESGTILHYDGSAWSEMNSWATADLYGIWGFSKSDIFVVGSSGTILRYDGSKWSIMNSGITADLYSVWGVTGTDVFVAGESGTIASYKGSTWNSMSRNILNDTKSIRGFSSVDVFAAGGSGTILRYLPPVLKSISNNQGNQGAILSITIDGTNLSGASELSFGAGVAVNSFTVLNSNQVTAYITIVGNATTGARDVSVTTPGGSFTLPNSFTVNQALPTIKLVSPDQERQGAALHLTITGTNLSGASEVRFGADIAVNSFSTLSTNQISVNINIAAAAVTGTRDVSVTTPGGNFTLPNSFTVKQALPTIVSINPGQSNRESTLTVTIDGTNLSGASEVQLGRDIVVNSFTVLSSNQIAAKITILTGAALGTRDVSVITPGGSFTLPNKFTVKQALPLITSISPNYGSQGATLDATIYGMNLNGASEVRLGTGIAVNSFFVHSANQIEVNITILAGAATGARDVLITTPGGSFTWPKGFIVKQGLPVVTSIIPDIGNQGATIVLIISGSNLSEVSSVSFGTGVTVQGFSNLSPTQIRVEVIIEEQAVTGVRDISVTTPGGNSTLGNSFNIKEKPLGIVFIILIWTGIAIVIVIFALILNKLKQKRAQYSKFPM